MRDSGCFAQIIMLAIVLGFFWMYDSCQRSEWMMMREARKSSNISSYSRYVRFHPYGKYIYEADDSVFSISNKIGNYEDYSKLFQTGRHIQEVDDAQYAVCSEKRNYDDYLKLFPNGKHINEVYDFVYHQYEGISIFDVVKKEGTYGSYDKYTLKEAYDTYIKYKETALGQRLKTLLETKTNEAYKNACKVNSIDQWQRFKSVVPSEYQKDADVRIQKLNDALWNNEATAWKKATQLNSEWSYSKYLEKHPNGKHRKQAIDNQVSLIMGTQHGQMPKMDRNYYTGYSYSTIDVYNNTQYHLTLLYSGKESKRVVLAPGKSQMIKLANGTYSVAASVNANNVRSYAGTETLNASSYSVSYYIQSYRY